MTQATIPAVRKIETIGNAPALARYLPPLSGVTREFHTLWRNPETLAAAVETMSPDNWDDSAWDKSHKFRGTRTMGEAVAMVRDGWKEGAARVEKLREKIRTAIPHMRRLAKWDVVGILPSVPRALSGNPACMKRVDPNVRARKTVTLVSDMGVNANVPAHVIENRAAACAAIVDAIERAGFSVNVVSTFSTIDHAGFAARVAVEIKTAGQGMNAARFAYGAGHSSMYRRLCFAALENERACKRLGAGLGFAVAGDFKALNAQQVYRLDSANDRKIEPKFDTEEKTVTQGVPALIDSLIAQGCPAFPR